MADLTKDANLRFKGPAYTQPFLLDTAATMEIYCGQAMMINTGTDTTHVEGFIDAYHGAATDVCVGIAAEHHSITAGDPETEVVNCYTWPSIVGFENTNSAFTNEDLGKPIYMSDSATLSLTATDNAELGTLFRVEDGYAYVKLTTPKITASTG